METDSQTCRQKDKNSNMKVERQIYRDTDMEADRHEGKHESRQT